MLVHMIEIWQIVTELKTKMFLYVKQRPIKDKTSTLSGSRSMLTSHKTRAAQLGELSTTAGYPWKLSMSAYLQNFATKNAVFTNLRNKNAVFTHFRDKYAVFTHFCVKNLWFHRYVTICLTRASTYTFRSCYVIILSPQVRA